MKTLDLSEANWIEDVIHKRKYEGVTIENCIPSKYEVYGKILHPFTTFADEQQARLEIDPTPVKWKVVAVKYGMNFYPDTNIISFVRHFKEIGFPSNLHFPDEGTLPLTLCSHLLKVLESFTVSGEVVIYQTAVHGIWKDGKLDDLVTCNFEEVRSYFNNWFSGYLYAADKSWIIFTDADLYFTIVGGTQKLVSALTDREFETIVCSSLARVDERGSRP
jgi:hypothetical protein